MSKSKVFATNLFGQIKTVALTMVASNTLFRDKRHMYETKEHDFWNYKKGANCIFPFC